MPKKRKFKIALRTCLLLTALLVPAVGLSKQKPATAPARKKNLNAEAVSIAKAAQNQFGEGYITRIDAKRHIVYISAVDKKAMIHVARSISLCHDVQRKILFPEPLRWNVTVVLPTLKDYRKLVKNPKVNGLYHRKKRTLVSISFSGVLVHEFIHALHHNDQAIAGQNHPIWITEGLATLFQNSRINDGKVEVITDAGLLAAQKAIKQKKAYKLAELCSMKQRAFVKDAETCYPQVRYVMLYLYRLGKLRQFYKTYKADYKSDPTGVKTLEELFGKPLAKIDSDWKKWVLAQKPPWQPAHRQRAHLGVRMKQTPVGVKVIGLVRNSAAARAGLLKVGDVIISLAGNPVRTPNSLTAAVRSCRPGQTIEIEVIRKGRTTILKHILGLAPK